MADSLKRPRLRKLPLNRAIISDIVLWLALASLLAYAVYFFGIVLPARRGQIIVLHFHNANEISRGSPVRMMGTDIGFVSDLRLENDNVAVTVQTYPNTLPIPSGSQFNILFTGLAGAKSVEVVPPDIPQPNVNGQPVYLVEEPIRMRDTLNASIDVTQALQKGAENITDFFGKKKPVEELQFNIHQAHQISVAAARNTQALNHALITLRKDVKDTARPTLHTVNSLTPGVEQAVSLTNPNTARPELRRFFQSLVKLSQVLENPQNGLLNPTVRENRLSRLNQVNQTINAKIQTVNQRVKPAQINQWFLSTSTRLDHVSTTLDRAASATSKDYSPKLKQARQSIQNLNQGVERINAKLSQPGNTSNSSNSSNSAPTP